MNMATFHCGAQQLVVPSAPTNAPILVVGDSLSAEYGLKRGEGWVALLSNRLQQDHLNYSVLNASISGETTAGGRSRITALLAQNHPQLVVVELGANDALRGLSLASTQSNLTYIVQQSRAAGARVLLIGMQVPPNYGQQYNRDFEQVFAQTARAEKASLVPFLLKGIADAPNAETLFQQDRIHPLAAEHPIMLNNVWPTLKKMLK